MFFGGKAPEAGQRAGGEAFPAVASRPPAAEAERGRIAEGPPGAEEQKKPVVIEFFGSTIQLPPLVAEGLRPFLEVSKRIAKPTERKEEPPETIPPSQPAGAVLTPEQVFRVLYPDFYLGFLRKAQDRLVKRGVITSAKQVAFANENEVLAFNDVLLADLFDRKKISEDQYRAYFKGRAFLFDRPYAEKYQEAIDILKTFGHRQGQAKQDRSVAFGHSRGEKQEKNLGAISSSVRFLLSILPVILQEARAQECFKPGAGGGGEQGGVNFMATCCEGCEEDGIACLSTCPGAAIWDPTTLICGCNYD